MKVGDTVLIRAEPETSGKIIEMHNPSQFQSSGTDVLVHVDDGIEDYWYHESEVIVAPHGESKEQVFLELLEDWFSWVKNQETTKQHQDNLWNEAKDRWKQRYAEAE